MVTVVGLQHKLGGIDRNAITIGGSERSSNPCPLDWWDLTVIPLELPDHAPKMIRKKKIRS
jgi:hypothetical protein